MANIEGVSAEVPRMRRQIIYEVIEAERNRQDGKWGGPPHDDSHGQRDWVAFVVKQLGIAGDAQKPRDYRAAMVKVAALAVAAIESSERNVEVYDRFIQASVNP